MAYLIYVPPLLPERLAYPELLDLPNRPQMREHFYDGSAADLTGFTAMLLRFRRVGSTTIEWVLTGRNWENGSGEQERLSHEVLITASLLQEISDTFSHCQFGSPGPVVMRALGSGA